MRIEVQKLTDVELMRDANSFTMGNRKRSKQGLASAYSCRHSPIRTQIFVIKMYGIPTATSTHLVRHAAVGQQHYVESKRPDLAGSTEEVGTRDYWRQEATDHMMVLNSQHLEEMAWDRCCNKASPETRSVMMEIINGVAACDPELVKRLVPRCQYLGRCDELVKCKEMEGI